MKQLPLIILIVMCCTVPTFAHDASVEASDAEYLVSAIGMFAILLTACYVLLTQPRK